MDIRRSSFNYAPSPGQPKTATSTQQFPRAVTKAVAGITGYTAQFEDEDHHFGRLEVEIKADIDAADPTKVDVRGKFQLRDASGTLDDSYGGSVEWVLLAEEVPAPSPAPGEARQDLLIVDAELTQAVQHFHTANHLAPPNVFPDNSIRLVAGKPTIVRLYIDYDATSGLPLISQLTGTLQVQSPTGLFALAPLDPISPRRHVTIDRGNQLHTLNFRIPEILCVGTIKVQARTSDAANASMFSAPFERELAFDPTPVLSIHAVGVTYTGKDIKPGATQADLAAPTEADFTNVLQFTENVYPTEEVVIATYQTIEYDGTMKSDMSQGCDHVGELRRVIADLQGDSDDILYGMFNVGVDTGTVGGCGTNGVAVGRIGRQPTAAHEIGHALGRKHAPCDNVTRCAKPRKQDPNYPVYSGYDSDSIGEYGFDANGTGGLKSPATAHDFMGYSDNDWISPYTYKALMSALPEVSPSGAAALPQGGKVSAERAEWEPKKTPHLFLRIDVDADGKVQLQEAFHYDAMPRRHDVDPTDLTLELRDASGRVLVRETLYGEQVCDCGNRSPRKNRLLRIQQAVPYHLDAATLIVYDADEIIHRQEIPKPTTVNLSVRGADDATAEQLELTWSTSAPKGSKVWFLVQWRDDVGTWRGVRPRLTATTTKVPKTLFRGVRKIALRVLATTGIATGVGQWAGTVVGPPSASGGGRESHLELAGVPAAGTVQIGPIVRATAPFGRADIRWYVDAVEVGHGRTLDLRVLPLGQTHLSAVAADRGKGAARGSWLVEHQPRGTIWLIR